MPGIPIMKVVLKHVKGLTFASRSQTGHWIMMDTRKDIGGHEGAPTPKELLLMSVGGCTAMDVASILTKMQQPFTDIQIEVKASMQEEAPKAITDIHIHYIITGNVDPERAERAIELSQDKYCSVSATLRPGVNITKSFEIKPDEVSS